MVASHSLDFMTKHEPLESLLGFPVFLVSLQEPADMPKADWNEALGLDAICRRIESTLRVRGEYKQAKRHSVQVLCSQKFLVTGMRVRRWSNMRIGLANPRSEIGSFEPLEPRLIEADGGRGDN